MHENIVPIVLFLTACTAAISYRYLAHKERIALIERGMDPLPTRKTSYGASFNVLKVAFLAIGIGIGVVVGGFLENVITGNPVIGYFASILLAGGFSLIAYYQFERKELARLEKQHRNEA